MSEEVALAAADLAALARWRRRAESAESSRDWWRGRAEALLEKLRAANDELDAARAELERMKGTSE